MSISKCVVRLKDCHDTEHSVEVYAESLYEAVLRGLNRLRDIGWESDTNETIKRVEVEIHQEPSQNDRLGEQRREQYKTLFLLAAASGLRVGELLALRDDDIDSERGTVRVDESLDRTGTVGPCKNVAAYRTVVLADANGQAAINALRQFVKHDGLVFRSKHGAPLAETTILIQGLYPALKNLGLPKGGMHAFRRGCNRRWELSRVPAALIRQQMGHRSSDMTALYRGEIPTEVVKNFLQLEPNGAAVAA